MKAARFGLTLFDIRIICDKVLWREITSRGLRKAAFSAARHRITKITQAGQRVSAMEGLSTPLD